MGTRCTIKVQGDHDQVACLWMAHDGYPEMVTPVIQRVVALQPHATAGERADAIVTALRDKVYRGRPEATECVYRLPATGLRDAWADYRYLVRCDGTVLSTADFV